MSAMLPSAGANSPDCFTRHGARLECCGFSWNCTQQAEDGSGFSDPTPLFWRLGRLVEVVSSVEAATDDDTHVHTMYTHTTNTHTHTQGPPVNGFDEIIAEAPSGHPHEGQMFAKVIKMFRKAYARTHTYHPAVWFHQNSELRLPIQPGMTLLCVLCAGCLHQYTLQVKFLSPYCSGFVSLAVPGGKQTLNPAGVPS